MNGAVHGIVVPQHGVELVDVLPILEVLLNALDVAGEAGTPPGVVGAHCLHVVCYLHVLVGPSVLLLACVVNGAEAAPGQRAVHVDVLHFNEPLHEVEPPQLAGDHQRSPQVPVQRCVLVGPVVDEVVDLLDVALDAGLLQPELELRQAVAKDVVGEALGVRPLVHGGVLVVWPRHLVEELSELPRACHGCDTRGAGARWSTRCRPGWWAGKWSARLMPDTLEPS
mmetsp:Transcript_33599/g.76141  ORF Transcript_33599/g.76141 Transcript_33599/m.76141 type:complete len:225 (-) Transcript_33599:2-676(-)